ncbi:hypothetical protein HNQ02_000673 [Flavobacterium sp. 7E]|uniref:hypothetical protein n=1 Tax=Flavobacterium sp. 7E TaxID=2735898 RepID=UPI0020C5CFD7|nr:hypothetical protein [Flavobacterium sp. 7E]NRS87766.1 hypothetical protein [Flavobacterium sp. 7E]
MKSDVNNKLKTEGNFPEAKKTELDKSESKEKTKTEAVKLADDASEIEVKHFQRVDKQGDLFSDFFSNFKK